MDGADAPNPEADARAEPAILTGLDDGPVEDRRVRHATSAPRSTPPADHSVLTVATPDGLERIHETGVELIRWTRPVLDAQRSWLSALRAEQFPNVRVKVPLGAVEAAAVAAFEARGVAASPGRHLLVADIVLLAMLLAHVERTEWLALRLQAESDEACPRPHVDQVTSRLLCTYRGGGTEFGRTVEGRWRRRLGLAPFEVGLVKGLLHPTLRDPAACSLAHRSPSVRPGDPPRLLVCIDRADAPSAATYH